VRQADCLDCPVTLPQVIEMGLPFWEAVTPFQHICFHQEPHFAANAVFHSSEYGLQNWHPSFH